MGTPIITNLILSLSAHVSAIIFMQLSKVSCFYNAGSNPKTVPDIKVIFAIL